MRPSRLADRHSKSPLLLAAALLLALPLASGSAQAAPAASAERAITVSLKTPAGNYGVEIIDVREVGKALWVLARVGAPKGSVGGAVITRVSDTVYLQAGPGPVKVHVLGKDWSWANEAPIVFVGKEAALGKEWASSRSRPFGRKTLTRARPYRRLLVPHREHGYSSNTAAVITTKEAYERFLAALSKQDAWNEREAFLSTLKEARIDFGKQALVFLRHTEGSGSVGVRLLAPVFEDGRLDCTVERAAQPDGFGTADMAFYGFALVVAKDRVKRVRAILLDKGKKGPGKITEYPL